MTPTDDPQPLQFDTAIAPDSQLSREAAAVAGMTCRNCGQVILDEYFDVNGVEVCASCRGTLEQRRHPPRGAMPFLRAALFGLGAAIAGAALYYAVIAITDFEIGIVSIAIGYMVGYAIQKSTEFRVAFYFDYLQSDDWRSGFLSRVRTLWKRYDIPLMVIRGHVHNAATPWCSAPATHY